MGRSHPFLGLLGQTLRLLGGNLARLGQMLRVERAHGRLVRDPLGHQRLGERRLVALVVPMAAVADEVDHDVAPEPSPEGEREPDRRERGLGIVRVDVD